MKLLGKEVTVHDLSHTLDPEIPTWDGSCGFDSKVLVDYDEGMRVLHYSLVAGCGTHMDAPSHFFADADSVDGIPLDSLIAPLVVLDVRSQAHEDYQVSLQDLEDHEKAHGKVPEGAVVVAQTGWSRHWSDKTRYRNADKEGVKHFPTFSPEVGEELMKRKVAGLGIDTLSPDPSNSTFPIHRLFLGAGKYLLENLTNLENLPPKGAWLLALPLKIRGGTESPLRAIALVES